MASFSILTSRNTTSSSPMSSSPDYPHILFKGIPFRSLLKCRLLDDEMQGWSGDEVMGDEDVVFQEVKIEKQLQILP